MKRKIAALVASLALVTSLTACERKSIDIAATGAQSVPGAEGLYYLCHGPTLLYVSVWESQPDEYEAMWPGWCVLTPEGKWVYPVSDPKLFPSAATTDGNVEEGDK